MDSQNKSLIPKVILVIFFLLFLGFLGALVLRKSPSPNSGGLVSEVKNIPTVLPTAFAQEGSVVLKTTDGLTKKPLSSTFTIDVVADSNGVDVAGYDVLMSFDPNMLEFVSAVSTLPEFRLFKRLGGDYVTLTATKQLSVKTKNVWTDTKIATVTFKVKSKGITNVNLITAKSKEVTQFVDASSKVHFPQTSLISLELY